MYLPSPLTAATFLRARAFAISCSEGLKKANLCGLLPRPAEAMVLPLSSRSS